MNKSTSRTRRAAGAIANPGADLEQALSRTSASWTQYMGRVQEETLHFTGACLDRYLEAAARFARCRSFADVVDAQAKFAGDLLSDFGDEGAMLASALYETTPEPHADGGETQGRDRKVEPRRNV